MQSFFTTVWQQLQQTSLLEFVAVLFGIISVLYSRKENILVYPTGLINTTIYIYLSMEGKLFGEASVNVYYTIMSIYGWILWSKKDTQQNITMLHITLSTTKEWVKHIAFFALFYIGLYCSLVFLKNNFAQNALPWADAFASATAYTAMWLMAKKKVESWWWWIATNAASIPLYYVKGYAFSSIQFIVFLILAIAGLIEWKKKATTI